MASLLDLMHISKPKATISSKSFKCGVWKININCSRSN